MWNAAIESRFRGAYAQDMCGWMKQWSLVRWNSSMRISKLMLMRPDRPSHIAQFSNGSTHDFDDNKSWMKKKQKTASMTDSHAQMDTHHAHIARSFYLPVEFIRWFALVWFGLFVCWPNHFDGCFSRFARHWVADQSNRPIRCAIVCVMHCCYLFIVQLGRDNWHTCICARTHNARCTIDMSHAN